MLVHIQLPVILLMAHTAGVVLVQILACVAALLMPHMAAVLVRRPSLESLLRERNAAVPVRRPSLESLMRERNAAVLV